jgi:hypothetical protein
MSCFGEEDEYYDGPDAAHAAQATGPVITTFHKVTTKIPPGYNGITSRFAYEEQIDDWTDVTELDPEKQGPAYLCLPGIDSRIPLKASTTSKGR